MLYDRWRQVVAGRPHQLALSDLATGRRWTFAELAAAVETGPPSDCSIAFPTGNGAEFVMAVLRAWRSGRVVCPLEQGQPAPVVTKPLPDGIAHLKLTSATTGDARLVAFRAEQLMADAENIVATMGLRPDWPNLGVISLAHSYGFSNLVTPLLLHGIPLILAGAPLPEAVRHAAATAPEVTLAAVPALWRSWHDADAIPRNVRLAISAGAPLPIALERSIFERAGIKIHNFYGSSECGGIAYDGSAAPRNDPARAGTALRNVAVSLAADGCLEVRSPAVAETYWPEPNSALGKGVFRTSDLGEIEEGIIYLRGRAGDQINVAGRKVLPETIERSMSQHPGVRSCLAFGVPSPDAERGETIVLCVAAKPGVDAEALRQFALSKLPAWQVPREWWLVESLEANQRGKISRTEWRKRYLARKR